MSFYPDDTRDPDTLVQHADTAMHAAKELGRRRYKFFSAQMNRRVVERLALEGDLRSALDQQGVLPGVPAPGGGKDRRGGGGGGP